VYGLVDDCIYLVVTIFVCDQIKILGTTLYFEKMRRRKEGWKIQT